MIIMVNNDLINSATLIVLRDNEKQLEVLLMHRHPDLRVLGGYWVFPGGAVEQADNSKDELSTAKNAAVRETLEETALSINANSLQVFEHWTTPEGVPKRFATWFFVAPFTDDAQKVQHDGSEMIASLWVTPEKALAMHRDGKMEILPPTYVSLLELADYDSVAEAMSAAQHKATNNKWRKFLPKVAQCDDQLVMLYQGDAGYEGCDAACLERLHRCVLTDAGWDYQRS